MVELSQQELKRRILMDFNKPYDEIYQEIKEIYPLVTPEQIAKWEHNKSLEYIVVDGQKRYFRRAVRNFFRIDKNAKAHYIAKFGDDKQERALFLKKYLPTILHSDGKKIFEFRFKLTVEPQAVPENEIIKCWLPQPQTTPHQTVLQSETPLKIDCLHACVFQKKTAKSHTPTEFLTKFTFCSKSYRCYQNRLVNPEHFVAEQYPHIIFSKKIKNLSRQIVGRERDKYLVAKKIFTWISNNIIWAAAREYSTIENIPEYVIDRSHGDCGQQTLLFVALCRHNGIAARWISGFMLYPNHENLHDWCEIYIENRGWLPVDVSFGIQHWTEDEKLKYFYFGQMDPYRLVVNTGISAQLTPPKEFERSESVDFQRGEVEWQKANIYFDKFDYEFEVEEKNMEGNLFLN